MTKGRFRYIYGPVSSWRLGSSLGIDPLSRGDKTCSFDCTYCQLGRTKALTDRREVFVPAGEVLSELRSVPPVDIDHITFSGAGEPTLGKNLGKLIRLVKKLRKEKTAVITNSSLFYRKEVQDDLLAADCVVAKLDAPSQELLDEINRPAPGIDLEKIMKGMRDFRSRYKGKFALQVMFVAENRMHAREIAAIAREIKPDEVQLNTPLRPCPVKPLSPDEMKTLEGLFKGTNSISVYGAGRKEVEPVSGEDTIRRRGKPYTSGAPRDAG
jgi:wyosine [tRNA(Phe)-imidazoG37] synthetase (radical SAM superfamily)